MLLEITKPDLILEENKILSTIIIFGGASITEESNIKKRLENIKELIKKNPKSILLKRNLNRSMGALEIPVGTYHRSISGKEGSIVLNQPKRDKFFDPSKEFTPQKLDKINLIKARKSPPVYWIYENNKIKRVNFNPLERKVKTLVWNEKTYIPY